jgi:hypothetical protein
VRFQRSRAQRSDPNAKDYCTTLQRRLRWSKHKLLNTNVFTALSCIADFARLRLCGGDDINLFRH